MQNHAAIFTHDRRIVWSDTDAAGIVYTVRIPQYCMEAIEAWFLDRFNVDWYELNTNRKIGTPFVNVQVTFRSRLTPRDHLSTAVVVERLGSASLTFALTGYANRETVAFEAIFTCVFVDNTNYKSMPIPDEFRAVLTATGQNPAPAKTLQDSGNLRPE